MNEGRIWHGRDEHCIILVLRAVGRRSDVRRGEDEHSWARYYYAIVLIHSCSRILRAYDF
jgi:hypothetical protein